jgi:hypothetical protein
MIITHTMLKKMIIQESAQVLMENKMYNRAHLLASHYPSLLSEGFWKGFGAGMGQKKEPAGAESHSVRLPSYAEKKHLEKLATQQKAIASAARRLEGSGEYGHEEALQVATQFITYTGDLSDDEMVKVRNILWAPRGEKMALPSEPEKTATEKTPREKELEKHLKTVTHKAKRTIPQPPSWGGQKEGRVEFSTQLSEKVIYEMIYSILRERTTN